MTDRLELRVRGNFHDHRGEEVNIDSVVDGTAVVAFVVDDEESVTGKVLGGVSPANMACILHAIRMTIGEADFNMALAISNRELDLVVGDDSGEMATGQI